MNLKPLEVLPHHLELVQLQGLQNQVLRYE
jgi:hypothetical protein